MSLFGKVRFTSCYNGSTAGIVLSKAQQEKLTVTQISRLFPYCEALKMERLERSEYYSSFEQAFNHNFEEGY